MKDEDTRVTLGKIKDMIEQLERKQLPAYQRYVPEVEAPTPKYTLHGSAIDLAKANIESSVTDVANRCSFREIESFAAFLKLESERLKDFANNPVLSESVNTLDIMNTLGPWNARPHGPH